MNHAEYKRMFEVEDNYWWYIGMRHLLRHMLISACPDGLQSARILDAGCGTGGMFSKLPKTGLAIGIDVSEEALDYTASRRIPKVLLARSSIVTLPFSDETFDIVISFDVLCCVREDLTALQEYCRVLKPNGLLIISVPAYEFLRSQHDAAVDIVRRYTLNNLRAKLQKAGLRIERCTCANTLLFPLAVLVRLIRKRPDLDANHSTSDLQPLPHLLNGILTRILLLESGLLAWLNLPFGLTLIALARRS